MSVTWLTSQQLRMLPYGELLGSVIAFRKSVAANVGDVAGTGSNRPVEHRQSNVGNMVPGGLVESAVETGGRLTQQSWFFYQQSCRFRVYIYILNYHSTTRRFLFGSPIVSSQRSRWQRAESTRLPSTSAVLPCHRHSRSE